MLKKITRKITKTIKSERDRAKAAIKGEKSRAKAALKKTKRSAEKKT